MARARTWVTDLRHFLDEETGDFPEGIPGAALNRGVFFGSIVAWVTDHHPEGEPHTNVPCWRSPGRRRCRGEIIAELRATSEIEWQCSLCGENGVIRGWEDTLWDRRRQGPTAAGVH